MSWRRVFQPNKRSKLNVGILVLVFLLLLLSVSGVFYIRFSLSWDSSLTSAGANDALVSFGFRPENFIGSKGGLIAQSSSFWWSQLVCFVLAVGLPFFRPIRASLSALLASMALVAINLNVTFGGGLTLEFSLMTVFILFAVYILLSFYGELVDKKQLTRVFSQYVPPEIAHDYSKNPEKINLEGEAREITVMFCDIQGFTSISERLDPRELAKQDGRSKGRKEPGHHPGILRALPGGFTTHAKQGHDLAGYGQGYQRKQAHQRKQGQTGLGKDVRGL